MEKSDFISFADESDDFDDRLLDPRPEVFLKALFGSGVPGSAARPSAVLNWAEANDDGSAFWKVVQSAWESFDRIPHESFALFFERFAESAPSSPSDLPERMTVYRGQSGDDLKGLSWSLSRQVAENFARGHRGIPVANPVVLELGITRDQVAFVCNDREEDEVVLRSIPF
jgi:hypothetical protein